jgi:uncharacterized protein (TIGR03083 family)
MGGQQVADFVAAHRAAHDGLLAATAGLDDAAWATPTGCPGWDVHDQLAHTIGTERMMLGEPPAEVEVPDLPHLRHDIGRFIERDVEIRRGRPGDELRAEAAATFTRHQERLAALDEAALAGDLDTPMGRMPARRALRLRLFDLACHEEDIRRALGLAPADGPHVQVAVGNAIRLLASRLPALLPDRAGRVALAVEGHPPVALDLAAGSLAPDAAGADASVHLDARTLLALVGGRSDAPAPHSLPIDGDRELATGVLAVAGITP